MRLRNDRVLTLLIALIMLSIGTGVQSAAPPPPANPQQNSPAPPSSPVGASSQSSPPQPASSQQAPGSQSPNPQTPPPPTGTAPGNGAPDAGAPDTNDSGVFVFKKEVEEVVLHATVVDDKRHVVTGLDRKSFEVFEDGKPQAITSFRREDVPVAMGIVIDNSGSMREKRDKVNKAALNLVRSSNPQDQVFVVNFNDEFYLDQDYTSDITKLREALEKVESRGGTAMYDALVASADHLKKTAKLQKKVIFVVTDGEDNESRESLELAVRRLQEENGPTVYAIGILNDEKSPRRAKRALETVAERTGGIVFLPRTVDEVDEISRTVARDIRNQYTIGYKSSTPQSVGGYRTVRVDANAKGYKKLTVRTRSGYYAGQSRASN